MRLKIIVSIVLCAALLSGCGLVGGGPQPTAVPPNPENQASEIVKQVNDFLINVDPVGYVLDTKFQAVDAQYTGNDKNPYKSLVIIIDCQGLCNRERTFSVAIMALKAKYGSLKPVMPDSISDLTVVALEHMVNKGSIVVSWKDAGAYFNNTITGAQLANRITKP
jgi:hypothetical protein